jgi:hypothetical protein
MDAGLVAGFGMPDTIKKYLLWGNLFFIIKLLLALLFTEC